MKRNVDLTLDRKFSRERDILNRLRRNVGVLRNRNAKYPWEFKTANARFRDSVVPRNPNFHTGDKATRDRKKIDALYHSELACDCCGRDFTKKPWIKGHYSLCNNCEEQMRKHDKYLWLQKVQEIIHRKRTKTVKIVKLEDVLKEGDL